jgi:hypothetical protein
MIARLLGSTDPKQLASFVTPAFFDVMPAKALFAMAKKLRADSKDAGAMRHAVTRREASLAQAASSSSRKSSCSGAPCSRR